VGGKAVTDTIEPVFYPYYPPSATRSPQQIASIFPDREDFIPSGKTSETRDRLKNVIVQGAEDLLTYLRYRAFPQPPLQPTAPRGTLPEAPPGGPPQSDLPVIRIFGRAAQPQTIGLAILGGLLLIGLFKDSRAGA
jgi:hypothetical protein